MKNLRHLGRRFFNYCRQGMEKSRVIEGFLESCQGKSSRPRLAATPGDGVPAYSVNMRLPYAHDYQRQAMGPVAEARNFNLAVTIP